MLRYAFLGDIETIGRSLQSFVDQTGIDEIMIASHLFDEDKKMRSLELTSSLFKKQMLPA
jgi:hypothetical protein